MSDHGRISSSLEGAFFPVLPEVFLGTVDRDFFIIALGFEISACPGTRVCLRSPCIIFAIITWSRAVRLNFSPAQ